ncbi:4-(cytidine 5'-diphospho)-2-C-methyl-D-erythritol kinase [Methylobacterium sp. J-068]|uniref:4-(cytidine 5'-diphospho)-2-C-methyl-D-erythritol kinase n=1 Tax=Methylobacterium sp. J-068 TaxID=2836649 RepID=UPI001FBB4CA4|nr:4-(cytidine 5'-diphospho)-2-C-methyl-D-erythritol kinase [Methylobacterium sp. J-068]MCJ2035128.1 4-(cytidine 5'-diphospho)-2-C-methyl-D-erythritol kinase [Methylobacterium sp. J-068]
MSLLVTRAPAKINLTLHVLGRRAGDGYHELESLVVFTGSGDTLTLEPGPTLGLTVSGPTAGPAGPLDDNLVIRAARHLARLRPGLAQGAFHLVKRLPVAAGIGGGSSDAAAALRLLARLNAIAPEDPALLAAARATGADVPVCLDPRARMMLGAGESIGPTLGLAPLAAVLINPGVPVETAPVFRALGLAIGQRHTVAPHPIVAAASDAEALMRVLLPTRNDLEAPALQVAPIIADALAALRHEPGCRIARMSGSGATVFGLFGTRSQAARAARHLGAAHPGWWVRSALLR